MINEIERLGHCVDSGVITFEEAAQRLFEYSEGGYTRYGARDLIGRWQTVRSQYEVIARDAREGLSRCEGKNGDSDAME